LHFVQIYQRDVFTELLLCRLLTVA